LEGLGDGRRIPCSAKLQRKESKCPIGRTSKGRMEIRDTDSLKIRTLKKERGVVTESSAYRLRKKGKNRHSRQGSGMVVPVHANSQTEKVREGGKNGTKVKRRLTPRRKRWLPPFLIDEVDTERKKNTRRRSRESQAQLKNLRTPTTKRRRERDYAGARNDASEVERNAEKEEEKRVRFNKF